MCRSGKLVLSPNLYYNSHRDGGSGLGREMAKAETEPSGDTCFLSHDVVVQDRETGEADALCERGLWARLCW
jgi:hypothetical protein